MKIRLGIVVLGVVGIGAALLLGARAEQILMQNGDRYTGHVLSMTAENIILQSDALGRVTIPRNKVANIDLGTAAAPSASLVLPHPGTNVSGITPTTPLSSADLNAAMSHLGSNTNFVEQIRKQFLDGAGPEANAKFDDLVGNMLGGKFDINKLRSEAKSAADQIRALKQGGTEVGDSMNTYLVILDKFLKESAPSNTPVVAVPSAPPSTNIPGTITIIK